VVLHPLRARQQIVRSGPDPVEEFLAVLQTEQGASRHTLAAYRRDLADFVAFLRGRRQSLISARAEAVVASLEHLTRVGLKASSVASRLPALRSPARPLVGEVTAPRDPP